MNFTKNAKKNFENLHISPEEYKDKGGEISGKYNKITCNDIKNFKKKNKLFLAEKKKKRVEKYRVSEDVCDTIINSFGMNSVPDDLPSRMPITNEQKRMTPNDNEKSNILYFINLSKNKNKDNGKKRAEQFLTQYDYSKIKIYKINNRCSKDGFEGFYKKYRYIVNNEPLCGECGKKMKFISKRDYSPIFNENFYGCPSYNKTNEIYECVKMQLSNCCNNDIDISHSQCRVNANYLKENIISSTNFIEVVKKKRTNIDDVEGAIPERASPNIKMSIDPVDQPVVSSEIDVIKKMQNQIDKMQSKIESLESMKPQVVNNTSKINIIWSFLKSFFSLF